MVHSEWISQDPNPSISDSKACPQFSVAFPGCHGYSCVNVSVWGCGQVLRSEADWQEGRSPGHRARPGPAWAGTLGVAQTSGRQGAQAGRVSRAGDRALGQCQSSEQGQSGPRTGRSEAAASCGLLRPPAATSGHQRRGAAPRPLLARLRWTSVCHPMVTAHCKEQHPREGPSWLTFLRKCH
jgi:hypothetical protein